MALGDWLLMASERGNPHARIDDVRSDGTAWSLGNEVTPLVHGATYFADLADRIAAMGVPAEVAPQFWAVARQNITRLDDLDGWWTLMRDGATPVIDAEDADFVRQALAMLPPRPWTAATWGDWTGAVKAATGRKGKGLFMPLRKALTGMDHGPEMAELMPLLKTVHAD